MKEGTLGNAETKIEGIPVISGTVVDLSVDLNGDLNGAPRGKKAGTGWEFVGWHTEPDAHEGLPAYAMPGHDERLYAIYQKMLKATFYGYEETPYDIDVPIYNNDPSGPVPFPQQSDTNDWVFKGWSPIGDNPMAAEITAMDIGFDMDFYGLYERTFTVTYDTGDGSAQPQPESQTQRVNSGDTNNVWYSSLSLAGPVVKDDFVFGGWKNNESGERYSPGAAINLPANITLTAIWAPINLIDGSGNLIPNGDFEIFVPYSLHNGTSRGENSFTLETHSPFLNVPGGVNNDAAALRVEQKNRNAFAGYAVSLKRDTVYEFEFDVILLHDSAGNTDFSVDVCSVISFRDPDIATQNHWSGTLPKVECGVWKTVTGTYDTTYPNGKNKPSLHADATPEDAHFSFFAAANGDNLITYLVDNVVLMEQGTTENLIPNGNFEVPIPFGNFTGGGDNTFAIDSDNKAKGKAALRIQQNSVNAYAGCGLALEPDSTYDFEYDIMVLTDEDGNDVDGVSPTTNFVFSDANAPDKINHPINSGAEEPSEGETEGSEGDSEEETDGKWKHVSGYYTLDSSSIHPSATPENAYFAIGVNATSSGKAVTYVVDNVKLKKRASTIVGQQPLNIFKTSDEFAFDFNLQSAANTDIPISWKITDYFSETILTGNGVIETGQRQLKIKPEDPLDLLKQPGHYVAEVSRPGETISENFAVINENREYLPDNPFGVSTFYAWYDGTNVKRNGEFSTADTRRLLSDYAQALKLSGITWVRDIASWKGMGYFNQYYKVYTENDLKLMAIVLGTPSGGPGKAIDPESINQGYRLPDDLFEAYAFGKHYGQYYNGSNTDFGQVNMWEVFNEPDGLSTGEKEGANRYAATLKAMSIGFHESGAPATMGGLVARSSEDYRNPPQKERIDKYRAYQDTLFKNGIMSYVEAYNFHNHQGNIDPAQDEGNVASAGYYNSALNHHFFSVSKNKAHIAKKNELETGLPDSAKVPAWNSEAGGAIANSPNGLDTYDKQQIQARFLVTSAVWSLSTGVDKHFWFNAREHLEQVNQNYGAPYQNIYWGSFSPYNLSTKQITPYAAYAAQAAMTEALGEAKYLGEVSNLPTGAEGHVFEDRGNTVLVLWADKTLNDVRLDLQNPNGTLTDIMGRKGPAPFADGAFKLQLSPDPVYLKINGVIPAGTYTTSNLTRRTPEVKELTPDQKIVLDQTFPAATHTNARAQGYALPANAETQVTVTVYNFNDTSISGTITGSFDSNGIAAGYTVSEPQPISNLKSGKGEEVILTFTIKAPATPAAEPVYLSFTGDFGDIGQSTPSVSMVK